MWETCLAREGRDLGVAFQAPPGSQASSRGEAKAAICKASPDSHFAFLHFFSMGMVLIPVSCTMSRASFRSTGDMGLISGSEDPLEEGMATYASILV